MTLTLGTTLTPALTTSTPLNTPAESQIVFATSVSLATVIPVMAVKEVRRLSFNHCNKCDATFDTPATVRHREATGEEVSEPVCPECGSTDVDEWETCSVCGEHESAESIYGGVCVNCLLSELSFNTFYDFITDGETVGGEPADTTPLFEGFMFQIAPSLRGVVTGTPAEIRERLKQLFMGAAETQYKQAMLSDMFDYLKSNSLLYDFAEYLSETGRINKNNRKEQ